MLDSNYLQLSTAHYKAAARRGEEGGGGRVAELGGAKEGRLKRGGIGSRRKREGAGRGRREEDKRRRMGTPSQAPEGRVTGRSKRKIDAGGEGVGGKIIQEKKKSKKNLTAMVGAGVCTEVKEPMRQK